MRSPTVTNATSTRSATVDVSSCFPTLSCFLMFSHVFSCFLVLSHCAAAFRPASPIVSTTEWFLLMECLDAKAAPMSKPKLESRPQIPQPVATSTQSTQGEA